MGVGGAALALLAVVAIGVRRSPIEADLTERAEKALTGAGFDSLSVSFDGRDGTLLGSGTPEDLTAALDLVARLEGVRVVDGSSAIADPGIPAETTTPSTTTTSTMATPTTSADEITAADATLSLTSSPDGVAVRGLVGSEPAADQVAAALQRTFPNLAVDNGLKFDQRAAGAPWLQSLSDAIASLSGVHLPQLEVSDGQAVVGGDVATAADRDRVLNGLRVLGLEITDRMTVTAPPPTDALSDALLSYLAGRTVGFASGSSEIPPGAHDLLDGLADLLGEPGPNVSIEGHTDDVGDVESNQLLSEARARAVVDYLVAKGVAPERLDAVGFGESNPVAPNDTEAGRAANRRIEFNVEGS